MLKRPRRSRLFLSLLVFFIFALSLCIWAFVIEPDRLIVNRVTVHPARWPASLDGLVIVTVGDIHAGAPYVDLSKVEKVVTAINAEHPDLICFLGDFVVQGVVGGHFVQPEATAAILKTARAPLGVYAVLGNHDGWYGSTLVRSALQKEGIHVLENEAVDVQAGDRKLSVAGLADLWTGVPNVRSALTRIPPANAIILLMHNPDLFPEIPSAVNLVLAAHTHGGQVNLPIVGRPVVPSNFGQRYAIGLIRENAHDMYVTPGVGTGIIPVRFRVPPEIAVLTIRASQ